MEKPSNQKVDKDLLDIEFISDFYSIEEAEKYFRLLEEELNWKQGHIRLFGKTLPEPRLTSYYGDVDYKYSGKVNPAQDIHLSEALRQILKDLKSRTGTRFNAVLANYYRSGQDSMGWHSDDELMHLRGSSIASLSFGDSRKMNFRDKTVKKRIHTLELTAGSLLIMRGSTQKQTEHNIPKQSNKKGRINLTFRQFSG